MKWLNDVVDETVRKKPDGEILVESGGSPSGAYHLGHLRELVTSDAIVRELIRRGRKARHIYFSDDLDALRKVPVNVPADFEKYLGKSLCDIPSPDGSSQSYADFFLKGLVDSSNKLGLELEFINSRDKYRSGFFNEAIEKTLEQADTVAKVLENVSGHKLGDNWSPIQINEDGYLKKREFLAIDKDAKTIRYRDKDGVEQTTSYGSGEVKLDWRIDWPARWWKQAVDVEPFGRDHASAGGSFETGAAIIKDVFGAQPPLPVPYDFINLAGDTKKMSASKGTGLDAETVTAVLPPEIVRFLILRYPANKRLYFDPVDGVSQLIDDFAELLAKPGKTPEEQQLLELCTQGLEKTVSSVPFSHLVASYQAALRDPAKTIEIIKRTEHGQQMDEQLVKKELSFIDGWLDKWAPDDIKFSLLEKLDSSDFSDSDKEFLSQLAEKVEAAPPEADGEYFHKAIYELKESHGLEPQELFKTLYQALIGQDSGPRAGWFLSILPRDWLLKRLRFEE